LTSFILSRRDRFLSFVISWLAWVWIQVIGRTSRLRIHASPGFQEQTRCGRPFIYAFWHRYQTLMLFEKRKSGVHVLVSRSRDGEFVAQALHRFGFKTVRGSSSRGGGAAFKALIDVVKNGECVAFTPDGPRGPLRSIQPGLLALAAKMKIPVVPLAWAGTRTKELKSWDKFLVPLPFGRYDVVFGEPLFFNDSGPEAEVQLRLALNAVEEEASQHLAGAGAPC
jgi:lysophospholipid acyltransferase (LPLAT)-like uncharacterized protein